MPFSVHVFSPQNPSTSLPHGLNKNESFVGLTKIGITILRAMRKPATNDNKRTNLHVSSRCPLLFLASRAEKAKFEKSGCQQI